MFSTLIRGSLRLRYVVAVASLALIVVGAVKMGDTPADLLPEFAPPTVEIQTEALGLSAAEVEQLITVPLEADLLNGVAWLDSIQSESIPSVSSIKLTFLPGTDLMHARQMVQEKLTQAHGLPNVSKAPVMLQPVSSTSRVMQIGLRSDELSLIDMSVLARWNIRPRLMGVPGVAHVSIWGQRKRQLQVRVDPETLREQEVSLQDVLATTGNALWVSPLSFLDAASPGTGGFIDTPNQRLGVRHVLPIVSPEGLSKVAIEGKDLRLGEVAEVVESSQPLIGDAIVGGDTGIMLVVEKFPWANTLDVTAGIEKALDDLRPGLGGIDIDTEIFRPATFIERALGNMATAAAIGLALLAAVLFVLFLDWRLTLIATLSAVTSMLLAWFTLFLTGVTVNALIIAGLMMAVGVVVHDAIADSHRIRQRLAEPRAEGENHWSVIVAAELGSRRLLGFGLDVVLLLALPLAMVSGVLGAFLTSVAASYALALIASLLVALLLTPALCLLLLPAEPRELAPTPLSGALDGAGERVAASFSSTIGKAAYVVVGLALAAVLAGLPFMQSQQLLPDFQERDLLINWTTKAGTSQPEMSRITTEVVDELQGLPGVRNVGAHVGRAVSSDKISGVNESQVWVRLATDADYEATVDAIDAVIDSYPGVDSDLTSYSDARIGEAIANETDKLIVRIYGQDTAVLSTEAQKVKAMIDDIDGVEEIEIAGTPMEPTVEIRVDLERARRHGIKPGDVRRAAATLLSGLEVGSLFEEKKVFDVIVWGAEDTRDSLSDIENLLIQSPTGAYVRLAEVAEVAVKPHPTVLKREGVARYADLKIDFYGRSLADISAEIRAGLDTFTFPMEYHADILGNYQVQSDNALYAVVAALSALIGIFLVLQAALRSWRLALIVLLALPVSVLGSLVAVLIAGQLSLGAFLGMLLVIGLGARFAILLYARFQQLERAEDMAFGTELVTRGTLLSATPMIATVLAVAAVSLPFAVMAGAVGLEILGPMAIAVIGGLITTLVMALFVLPVVYLGFGAGAAADEDFEDLLEARTHAS